MEYSLENCEKEVLFAKTGNGFEDYVNEIFTEGSQLDVWQDPFSANSWICHFEKVDEKAYILIDLGCSKHINGFYLRDAKTKKLKKS